MTHLSHLRAFVALYEAQKVSLAATTLGLSQPGMSNILKKLRADFADELFVSTGTGVIPTARSHELIEPIRRMIAIFDDEVINSRPFIPTSSEREFSIALSDMTEYIFLPDLAHEIQAISPRCHLRVYPLDPRLCEAQLRDKQFDVAIGFLPDTDLINLVETVISNNTFGCFVAKNHELAGRKVTLEQFCDTEHVVSVNSERGASVLDQHLARHRAHRRTAVVTSRLLSIPELVARTRLMAILPLKPGWPSPYINLAQVFPPFDFPVMDIKMYWHRVVDDDPGHRWFRQLVARVVRTIGVQRDIDAPVGGGWPDVSNPSGGDPPWPPMQLPPTREPN